MRTFIRPGLSVTGFFAELQRRKARYVVLRWFEDLPIIEPGEDIDLLVDELNLSSVLELTDRRNKGGVPLDIYTPTGANRTTREGTLVFPLSLSRMLLEKRKIGENGVWHPSPDLHFVSLAFHALFHKGHKSGLVDSDSGTRYSEPEHDYQEILESLADVARVGAQEISLSGVWDFFKSSSWFPSADMMDILVRQNPWLAIRWAADIESQPLPFRNLSVFVVRELGRAWVAEFEQKIERMGFHTLLSTELDSDQSRALAESSRGGNWGRGPFPISGGNPAHFLVAVDAYPVAPDLTTKESFPALSNFREHQTKSLIRKTFNRSRSRGKRANVVHSSDNGLNALAMCELVLDPTAIAKMAAEASRYLEAATPDLEGYERIPTGAKRAIVLRRSGAEQNEIVKWFKPEKEVYLQRELSVRELLGEDPRIIPIKQRGNRWFSMEEVSAESVIGNTLSVEEIKAVKGFAQDLRRIGIEAFDFFPRNILRLNSGELKFIDFEYFQAGTPRAHLWGAAAFSRVSRPQGFELPLDYRPDAYERRWRPVTRLPRWAMLVDLPDWTVRLLQLLSPKISLIFKVSRMLRGQLTKKFKTWRIGISKGARRAIRRAVDMSRGSG